MSASDLCEYFAWFVYIQEDRLVISMDRSLVSHIPGLVLWLKIPWHQRLVASDPLELGMTWELDGLLILILPYLSLCCGDIQCLKKPIKCFVLLQCFGYISRTTKSMSMYLGLFESPSS